MNISKPLAISQLLVGKFIRELRQEIGLTQEQFASYLGVTYSTINRWENGRGKPSPLAMQKIEVILEQMGEHGQELLARYVSQ